MHKLAQERRTNWQSVLSSICMRGVFGLLLLLPLSGCNRQDAEALARIGRKVAAHARANADEMSANLDLPWKNARKEPALQEKIQDRLRWESMLTEFTLEVQVKEKDVELKGSVKTAQQRQRAIELAESVAGVEKVHDAIQVTSEK